MKLVSKWLYKRRWPLLCCGGVLLVFLGCCAFLRISNLSDVLAYIGMVKNYDPLVKDFALRRFNMGDSISDLLKRHPKMETGKLGPFSYSNDSCWADSRNYTSFFVLAKDDKLVCADADGLVNGLPWDFTFFYSSNDCEMFRQLDAESYLYEIQHSQQKFPDTAKEKKP